MRQRRHLGGRILRARLALGAIGVGVFVMLSAPAAQADTCSPLDLQCIAQQGGDTLGGTLGGVVDKGKDVLDKGKDIVDGGLGTVGGIVQKGTGTVGSVLNPGGGSGGSGGGSGGSGGGSGGSGGGSGGSGGGAKDHHHHGGPVGSATSGTRTSPLNTAPATTDDAAKAKLVAHRSGGVLRSIGGTAVRTAKQLSFPLVLAVIVAMFVAIQDRLDRNDPKLALAPLTPDRMRFV